MSIEKEDLLAVQLKLEEEMTARGATRFLKNIEKNIDRETEDLTSYSQQLTSRKLEMLSIAIDEWKSSAGSGVAVRNGTAYKLINEMPSTTLAFLTLKYTLSGISKIRTVQKVGVAIGIAIEDEMRFEAIRKTEKGLYKKLYVGASKRNSMNNKHIYAVRLADRHTAYNNWTKIDTVRVGVKMLEILMESIGIVKLTCIKLGKTNSATYVEALPTTLTWIAKHTEALSILRPMYEPMVVIPRDWNCPLGGGYLSSHISPLKLVKTNNKSYFEELENTDIPLIYKSVNNLQRTPWQINTSVLDVMKTLWDSHSTIAGIPNRDGVDLPQKPHDIDTNEEARKEWRIAASKLHIQNLTYTGQRASFTMALSVAERYRGFRKIYFPYQLDFRGRIYAVPHLNPQGSDYQKSLLRFADGKALGEEGWKWLAVLGSNLAGHDKVSFEDRVNWVLDNEEEIAAIAEDPYNNQGWCGTVGDMEISEPWQFLAFCFEWRGFLEHGDTYVSKLPVAMDGSCSGIQHFSAMLRDSVGGGAVNLIPAAVPQDVYQLVADCVIKQAQEDCLTGTEDTLKHTKEGVAYMFAGTKRLAQQWLEFGITRKVTKRPVMVLSYGSKVYGFKEQTMSDILRPAKQEAERGGKPFPFDGDGYSAALYMASAIWSSVNEVLVKAGEAMEWIQKAATVISNEQLPVRWTTPVGFPVMQHYPDIEKRSIKCTINGKLTYMRMNKEKDKLNKRKMAQSLPPNVVHSFDAAHMMLTVCRASDEGITNFACIHDSFGTTAGDLQKLYRIVRETFVEIYDNIDVLQVFEDEITESLTPTKKLLIPPLPTRGDLVLSEVLNSNYCFA
jgi:DNA-directed RNA polymerase